MLSLSKCDCRTVLSELSLMASAISANICNQTACLVGDFSMENLCVTKQFM